MCFIHVLHTYASYMCFMCFMDASLACWALFFLNAKNEPFSLNYRESPTLTLLNVLGVLGVLNVLNALNVLHVLNMPTDASLACWALFPKLLFVS